MAFFHYDGGVVADQATGRPLMGQPVRIFDEETDAPIQAYREGQPVTLVTGAHGLIPQFQTEDTTRRVRIEVGPVRLRQWSQEMIGLTIDAAQSLRFIAVQNLLPRPGYEDFPLGWQYYGAGGGKVADETLTVTGSGALTGVGVYTQVGYRFRAVAGHRYYVHTRASTPDSGAASISVYLSDGTTTVNVTGSAVAVASPAPGMFYTVSGLITAPEAWDGKDIQFYQRVNWPTPAEQNGRRASFQPATILDLTKAYGEGSEPDRGHLDALVASSQGGYVDGLSRLFDQRKQVTPLPVGGASNRQVELRFDDGYTNNLTNAAPVMARHGFRGVIYPGTHPTAWLGGSHGGHPIMNAAQLLSIHSDFGWEVGSHTRDHSDANNGDPYVWVENARQACQDLVDIGLPWPSAFAYPNGGRNVVTDRAVYRLHDTCGLTGHPSLTPIRKGKPAFFTGWATINGVTGTAADIERAKTYVLESARRGEIPVLGFHGITDGAPDADYHLSKAHFSELMDWLAAQGFSTVLPSERTPHNMLKDPGFESRTFGYPWVAGAGWTRTRSTAAGHTGFMGADLASGGTGELYQNTSVMPGQSLRVRVRFGARTVSGGTLAVVATPQGPTGAAVGSSVTIGTASTGASESDVTGLVTVPSGASVLRVAVVPSSFVGSARVVHAALHRSDLYDPLA
ncbi:polysaccharide deacetylase family protein [Micrococcus terreus]|uniref:polysaccharide deacetylase family protein n=1 Tax=Micrococcus terreus TaxID=574650 RepID=UPI00254CB380|nr:polysaccharide deacetylase family protein [Micrococcus terreus]MDK7701482.1 polysaccharide deacetylase family protein [Micrococcus terreus]WOO98182.1 polysaccharide deacetylase family protein [Micrococcus terreus]